MEERLPGGSSFGVYRSPGGRQSQPEPDRGEDPPKDRRSLRDLFLPPVFAVVSAKRVSVSQS